VSKKLKEIKDTTKKEKVSGDRFQKSVQGYERMIKETD